MIQLFPKLEKARFDCPVCSNALNAEGYYIPGMRCLAALHCPECGRKFYGDLPAGHGLYYPMLLDKETGLAFNRSGVSWFADWLEKSYRERRYEKSTLEIEVLAAKNKIVLINCLDKVFGHSLLKLLNAQYYIDNEPDKGVVVLIPGSLRWMVPDGVAEIWTVNQTFRNGICWNDALAEEIQANLERFVECWLSPAFSHPHPAEYSIERFTKVAPFPLDEWDKRLDVPKITFIWRSDRLWTEREISKIGIVVRIVRKARRLFPFLKKRVINREMQAIKELATILKQQIPNLDFAVAGFGDPGGLPPWIKDMRTNAPDVSTEKNWCRRYADSHLVIGVCGSNMLLPSAHAGATIDLMPDDKWANLAQDLLFQVNDQRETLYHYRLIPTSVSAESLAKISATIVRDFTHNLVTMKKDWCDLGSSRDPIEWSMMSQAAMSISLKNDV